MNAPVVSDSPGRAELVFALGVGLLLLSGLLPWITASEAIPVADPSEQAEGLNSFSEEDTSDEVLGIDRVDWVVLAGVGLVATVLVMTEPWSRVVLAVAGASGLAAVGLGAVYLVDPAWMYSDWIKSEVGAVASAGPGVYLALASGIVQFGGIYLGATDSESTTGAQQLDAPAQRAQTDRSPRTQPPGGQPPQDGQSQQNRQPDQSPSAQRRASEQPPREGGTDPSEDAATHSAGDARQGAGSGQQPTEQRPRTEGDHSSDDTDRKQ